MRLAIPFLLKAAVSALLLYFALGLVDLALVKERLIRADPSWIALMFLVLLFQTGMLALRWQMVVASCGSKLPLPLAFRFSVIALFFNQTLPSSIGGDAMRIWLVGKHTTWRTGIYSVFLDRLIGVIALAALVILCLPWTFELIRNPLGRAALLLIGFGSLGAGVAFIGLGWKRLGILQHWTLTRHLADLASVALVISHSPRSFVPPFAVSVLIHLLTALAAWCAAVAIGAQVPILYALFLVPPVVLLTVIPISIAGWGVRESAMVTAFGYAGLPQSDGLLISLLFGASSLVLGVVGGLTWIATPARRESRIDPSVGE
jgi:uncharacterized membrane protein YbhN (UPF0104 family)